MEQQEVIKNILNKINSERLTLDSTKEVYWEIFEKMKQLFYKQKQGREFVNIITKITDEFVTRIYKLAEEEYKATHFAGEENYAVIAVGGYGRGELNPFSDLDLLFLVPFKVTPLIEYIGERVYYALWDTGLNVGYSHRNINECIYFAQRDITVKTALLDNRFIYGDITLYNEYREKVMKKLLTSSTKPFIKEKIKEIGERRNKYGRTVFMLEPDIKSGEGGLRDIHAAWWLSRIKFKINNWKELYHKGIVEIELIENMIEGQDFLFKIRNFVHYHSKRKNDKLYFSTQNDIADFFDYKSDERLIASEKLMKDFYINANQIKETTNIIISKTSDDFTRKVFLPKRKVIDGFVIVGDKIHIPGKDFLLKEQIRFLKVFQLIQQNNLELDLDSFFLLKRNSPKINDELRNSSEARDTFLKIITNFGKVYKSLKLMLSTGVLYNYIPEFKHLYGLMQHDVFHIYTVDTHLLFAVKEIEDLLFNNELTNVEKQFKGIFETIRQKEILLFATLFHDIGKGLGGQHSIKGAEILKKITERMDFSTEDSERIIILVKEHLTLVNMALRRDINDKNLLINLIERIGDFDNLASLLILTYADIKSVRPDESTEWKLSLFLELYNRTVYMLESGDTKGEWLDKWKNERYNKALSLLREENIEITPHLISSIENFPRRFYLSNSVELIVEISKTILKIHEKGYTIKIIPGHYKSLKEIIIITDSKYDRPGLFADLVGILSYYNINIIEAQIYTLSNNEVVDIFEVTIPENLFEHDKKQRLTDNLTAVIKNKLSVMELIFQQKLESLRKKDSLEYRYPAKIKIDNQSSKHFTLIDIVAKNYPGILYQITRELTSRSLEINYARISSFGPRIADIYYVRDLNGNKLTSKNNVDNLINSLIAILVEEDVEITVDE